MTDSNVKLQGKAELIIVFLTHITPLDGKWCCWKEAQRILHSEWRNVRFAAEEDATDVEGHTPVYTIQYSTAQLCVETKQPTNHLHGPEAFLRI